MNRIKMFSVPRRVLVNSLMVGETKTFMLNASVIPEGADIIAVHDNPMKRAFEVYVHHESFDEVAEGAMVPVEELVWTEAKRVEYMYISKDEADTFTREEFDMQVALGLKACGNIQDVMDLLSDVRKNERAIMRNDSIPVCDKCEQPDNCWECECK